MEGNAERAVIEAARPNLANMTQAIVKPEITGHFELKKYMTDEVLGHTFVDGLDEASKMNLDSACGVSCMAKSYSEIQLLLNNFTATNHNWQRDGDSRKEIKQIAARLIELDDFSAMRADIAKLVNQVNRMTMQQTQQMHRVQQMSLCSELCGDNHMSNMCPTNPESIYYVGQQSRGPMNQNTQYGNIYNPNWNNHPNFSWGGNQPNQTHYIPQGNFNQPQKPPQQVEESTNDLLKKLLLDNQQLKTDFRDLERQMGQLTSAQNTRPAGALPSDTEANPKASLNVVSLRNGRQLEEVQSKKRKHMTFNEKPATIESTSEKSKESEKLVEEAVAEQLPPLVARPPPPFPQRLHKVKDIAAYKKFLDILKQVRINIPLVDILQEVPKYAKYIKDIVANKRRMTEFETVALTEEFRRSLCDLGASVNLMPLSVFRVLGLGEPRPTTVILQLADRSLSHPEGVTKDVLVQVGSFIFPVDFIILDYELD
ncbi:PREDICTED: uncharacterized protein LOC109228121 [Nicotiana attenuata]|uniref:uncharacterized protein LOC109228121 n=1 Tax=Nicotiana attenuata TaxID=49451 RepID=UPI0009047385|nr:PREDICTED: uncharacterized protein LOC109228121 [Nicotiana attenuata]